MYSGKEGDDRVLNNLSACVVLNLMQPYLNRWHKVYMDNFYSSPELFCELLEKETYAFGTVRSDPRGLPSQFGDAVKSPKSANHGEHRSFYNAPVLAVA